MDSAEILRMLPASVKDSVVVEEKADHYELHHPFLEDAELFEQIKKTVTEKLGGRYFGYYSGYAHYEIPKVESSNLARATKGVTPHVVSMDKAKPPEIVAPVKVVDASIASVECYHFDDEALTCAKGHDVCDARECPDFKEIPTLEEPLGIDSEATYKEVGNEFPKEIGVQLVKIDSLIKSPWWPRKEEPDQELVESIKKWGVRQNLEARWKNDGLELVYGHRRWFAAKKAGLTHVPVKIRKLTDTEALQIQFEENDKQKSWTDLETAHYLQAMMGKLDLTQEELAKQLGKSQPWVSQHLAMLKLPENITRVIKSGELTEFQARELLKATPEQREEILKEAEETGELPSSREIERRVKPRVCENCGVATSDVEDWHGHKLCGKCHVLALENPSFYHRKLNQKQSSQKPQPTTEKVKEAWKDRKARMETPISQMDEYIYEKAKNDPELRKRGYTVVFQKEYVLTKSDVTIEKAGEEHPVFLDKTELHVKRQARDETITSVLLWRDRVKQVVRIPYQGTFSEKKGDEVYAKMMEMILDG